MSYQRSTAAAILSFSVLVLAGPALAQTPASPAAEANRAVKDGGIKVAGWKGAIDASEASSGEKLENARLTKEGDVLHVITGPAVTYWNPANTASGNYTVKATFMEPAYMSLNDHPHPYGIVIGGNGLGTAGQSYLYCAAYGNGSFIVRGFGPAAFKVNGQRAEPNEAVHKAAGKGQPVTQEIAVSVQGDQVQCAINGTVVGTYPKSAIVGDGKLKSTDGVYGIRVAHNAEAKVSGLTLIKDK